MRVDGVALGFEGRAIEAGRSAGLADVLRSAMDAVQPGDYLAVLAYLPAGTEGFGAIEASVAEATRLTGKPICLELGPRYLHSTGQLHKGGPSSCLVLQLTVDDNDLDIPGEAYGFGTLLAAQAMGDCQALVDKERRVARVHIGSDAEAGILRLLAHI